MAMVAENEFILRLIKVLERGDYEAALHLVQDPDSYETLELMLGVLGKKDPETQTWILGSLSELFSQGRSDTLRSLRALDYEREPVSPEQFFTDGYYMGWMAKDLGEVVLADLCYVSDPKNRVCEYILKGGIGWGKTTSALLAISYRIYRLSCMRDPAICLGLLPKSPLFFGLYSVFTYKADDNYNRLQMMIDGSKYFRHNFPRNPRLKMGLEFAKGMAVRTGASALQALGDTLIALAIDEMDFMDREKRGVEKIRVEEKKNKAYELYSSCLSRVLSRFAGEDPDYLPALMILISSARAESDFLQKHTKESVGRPEIFISEYAVWEVRNKDWKSFFYVQVGDHYHDSKILEEGEAPIPGLQVLKVPTSFRKPFDQNLVKAIRDEAGVACSSEMPWVPRVSLFKEIVDPRLFHPFTKDELILSTSSTDQLSQFFQVERCCRVEESAYEPFLNSEAIRAIHVDLSKTRCATGIAMGHVSGVKEMFQRRKDMSMEPVVFPIITVDFILRIRPPVPPAVIDYDKILVFFSFLKSLGYTIGLVTYDGYQSEHSLQILKKSGWNAELLSCDRAPCPPYTTLSDAIVTGRFKTYDYQPFTEEASHLQVDTVTGVVYKEEGRFKDVADAVAGMAHNVSRLFQAGEATRPVSAFETGRGADRQRAEDSWTTMLIGDYKV